MPLYKYRCECGKEFEAIKAIEDREEAMCFACGGKGTHAITTVGFDPKMGLDPAFPTANAKWARTRERAARGK